MSWRISYTLPVSEQGKLCGRRDILDQDNPGKADLMEAFLDTCVELRPHIVVECTECGYSAEIEWGTDTLGLPTAHVTQLQCDCDNTPDHKEWREADLRSRRLELV